MSPDKIHRISRACESCNKKKIRCKPQNGMVGCKACVENGIECVARTRKKRKCTSIQHSNTEIGKSPEASGPDSTNATYLFHPIQPEHQIPKIAQSRLNSMNGGHDWYEDAISRLASDSQGIKPSDLPVHEVQRASQDEMPIMIAHDNGVDTSSDQPCVVRLSDIDYQILQLRAAFQLPPRSIRESLNDSFMDRCYPWMPIIERSWLEEGKGRRISVLLVQAVFLAASRVSSSPTVAAFASSREFYQRAKTLFWMGHEHDALMTIRATCILNWYIPHGPEQVSFDTSKFWTQIAVGLAHQIGLHKEPPPGKANIMRRRLWWSLVVRDSILSASHGRPRGINLDDCDVRRPSLEDFPESLLEGHLFLHYVEVCTILGDLIECYSRKHMSRHHKLNVQHSMFQWTRDLPDELRLFQKSANSDERLISRYNFNARQLHVPYFAVLTIMYKSITPSTGPSAISVLAASYIAGIYEDFLARDEIQYLPAIFSFYGAISAVSLASFHRYPQLRKSAEQDLAVIISAERELGKRWPAARGIRNALENMIMSVPKPNADITQPQMEVPRADIEAYFSEFGPGLCRVRDVVLGHSGAINLNLGNKKNDGTMPFDYMRTAPIINAEPTNEENFQQLDGTMPPDPEGELEGSMFSFQYDGMGYWLFDNSGIDFPLQ